MGVQLYGNFALRVLKTKSCIHGDCYLALDQSVRFVEPTSYAKLSAPPASLCSRVCVPPTANAVQRGSKQNVYNEYAVYRAHPFSSISKDR